MTLAQRIGDYSSPSSLGSRFRAKRIQPLLEMIAQVSERAGSCSIIDVGGTRKYWSIVPADFLREHRVSILITNITATATGGVGAPSGSGSGGESEDDGVFRHAYADACNLPYPDRSFDILHSNSVIEHVGTWEDQLRFSREATRVAGAYFIQTPNYWFPWEPHFGTLGFQYLPMPWQISLLLRGRRGFRQQAATVDAAVRSIESCRLLDERRFRTLFPDAELQRERFCGLTKSLIAIRPPG